MAESVPLKVIEAEPSVPLEKITPVVCASVSVPSVTESAMLAVAVGFPASVTVNALPPPLEKLTLEFSLTDTLAGAAVCGTPNT